MKQRSRIRSYDSKINALSRLVDSGIIVLTFFALLDLFYVEMEQNHAWGLLFAILMFNFFAESQDAYRSWRGASLQEEVTIILISWFTGIFALVLIDIVIIHSQLHYDPYIITWIIIAPIEVILWHGTVKIFLSFLRSKGYNTRRVAIVGATSLGQELERSFSQMHWSGYKFVGYYDDRAVKGTDDDHRYENVAISGNLEQMLIESKAGKIDAIYITLAMSAEKRVKTLIDKLADTTVSVYLVPDLFSFNLLNSRWVDYQGVTAISIHDTPFTGLDSAVKRLEDIILSIIILTIIAVPMLFIALGIKMTSKGPIFFTQDRYGMDGERIKVRKFRSMTVAENGEKVIQAQKGDSRITSFGGFLRKTSLDELPQFLNALGGGMSIVGPRPHAVAHNEEYRSQIQGYMLRHKMKPGITGLAQISGFRGETDTLDKMEGRIKYDLQYIRTWSLWLDLKIIFMTIFKGFINKNAY